MVLKLSETILEIKEEPHHEGESVPRLNTTLSLGMCFV